MSIIKNKKDKYYIKHMHYKTAYFFLNESNKDKVNIAAASFVLWPPPPRGGQQSKASSKGKNGNKVILNLVQLVYQRIMIKKTYLNNLKHLRSLLV